MFKRTNSPFASLMVAVAYLMVLASGSQGAEMDPSSEKATDQTGRRKEMRLCIRPSVSSFHLRDSGSRERFGKQINGIQLSVGLSDTRRDENGFRLSIDRVVSDQDRPNHFSFIPIGLTYRQYLGEDKRFRPYADVGGGLCFADVTTIEERYKRRVGSGMAILGANVNRHLFIEARFHQVPKIEGINLSGVDVVLGGRF